MKNAVFCLFMSLFVSCQVSEKFDSETDLNTTFQTQTQAETTPYTITDGDAVFGYVKLPYKRLNPDSLRAFAVYMVGDDLTAIQKTIDNNRPLCIEGNMQPFIENGYIYQHCFGSSDTHDYPVRFSEIARFFQ